MFKDAVDRIVSKLDRKKYDGIYAIPRGGWILGVFLSHKLKLNMISKVRTQGILIVDDICDTGETLLQFPNNDKVTLVVKDKGLETIPKVIYDIKVSDDTWVDFFWEV